MASIGVVVLSALASVYSDEGNVHVDRVGEPLAEIMTASHASCHNLCVEVDECVAWSWHRCEVSCRLFNEDRRLAFVNTSAECGGVSGNTASMNTTAGRYSSLRLATISPTGWLLRQLQLQATGQAGHLDEFWNDIEHSIWIGGKYDHSGAGHERGPYWLNGQVPLAALLNASVPGGSVTKSVVNQTEHWIHYVLNNWVNTTSGWLGPDGDFGDPYWSGWNMAVSLLQYATALNVDSEVAHRCDVAVLRYLNATYSRMVTSPLVGWSQTRYQDLAYIAQFLSQTFGTNHKQLLYDLTVLATEQGIDWVKYYNRIGPFKVPEMNTPTWTQQNHGVNNAMGTKAAVVGDWIGSAGRINKTDLDHQLTTQDKWHGQPHGMFSADECFGGRGLSRGIELCAVVEQMYSLELAFAQFGDVSYVDRAERISLNALPGTITSDMWQHQYLQQSNSISAAYNQSHHVWQTDGPDATGFGVEPNFGCCTANHPQGWPKYAQNVFLTYQNGTTTGVAVVFIAPAKVNISNGPLAGVRVELVTDYPFDDKVIIQATLPDGMKSLSMRVRIPSWATAATITQSGRVVPCAAGVMNDILITPSTLRVSIDLSFEVRLETGWGAGISNAAAVLVGPLLYGVPLTETTEVVRVWRPFNNTDVNITTSDRWNFALVLDPSNLKQTLSYHRHHSSNPLPFQNNNFTSTVTATVRTLSGWVDDRVYSTPSPQPPSPLNCTTFPGGCSEDIAIQLVPYGSTNIRMSALPWVCLNQNDEICFQNNNKITSSTTTSTVTYGEVSYNGTADWVDDISEDVTYWVSGGVGDNNKTSSITISDVLLDPIAVLSVINIDYQFMSNRTSVKGSSISFTVSLVEIKTNTVKKVWSSPPLTDYPIQRNIWSPIQTASIAIGRGVSTAHRLLITFDQRDGTLFVKAPLQLSFYWS